MRYVSNVASVKNINEKHAESYLKFGNSKGHTDCAMENYRIVRYGKQIVNILFLRRTVALLFGFFGVTITMVQRMNITFAILDMVNSTLVDKVYHKDNRTTIECPIEIEDNSSAQSLSTGEFSWSPELQGYIIGSGFIGNVLGQLPGGIFVAKFGTKKTTLMAMLIDAAVNLLSPTVAFIDPYLLMAIHTIKGFAQGVTIVSINVITSNWFPRSERGFAGSIVGTGFTFGALIGSICSGYLCSLDLWNGWPLVFYVPGLLTLLLITILSIFYHNLPEEDPWITETELLHIQDGKTREYFQTRPPTPWFRILTSKSVIIMSIALIGHRWIVYYYFNASPIYYGDILNIPIKKNGYMNGGSYLAQVVASFLSSYLSLWIHRRYGIGKSRRILTFACVFFFCLSIGGTYFSKCDIFWNTFCLYIGSLSVGLANSGVQVNAIDIAPTFSGPVFGLSHSIGNISGFLIPVIIGILTDGAQNMIQWRKFILITIAVTSISTLQWLFFGTTDIEKWDPASKNTKESAKEPENTSKNECTKF